MNELVLAQVRNGIGHLTLNRPSGLNALNLEMIRLLSQHLRSWQTDPAVRAVVLRGNGDKAFCAGGDIRMLYDSHKAGSDQHFVFFDEEYALDQLIHGYAKPVLALLDGFVLGGGMGLVQGAWRRVIGERCRMGMPETAIGFFPDVGGSYFLPRLPGALGIYLALTGEQVGVADALYAELADQHLPRARWAQLDQALDQQAWGEDIRGDLGQLLDSLASEPPEAGVLAAQRPAIDEHFSHTNLETLLEGLAREQRQEHATWAAQTLATLRSRSPLAVAVTFALMRRGARLSLAQCFAQEQALGRQWFERGDLIEGVRALIVDKDKQPRWQHSRLEAVSEAQVQALLSAVV